MKHIPILLLAFLSLSFGYAQDFTVDKYAVDITIHEEGYFDVVESYDLTFAFPKHGIYRDIQTSYDVVTEEVKQETRKIMISNVEVPGRTFITPSNFEQKLSETFQIKIGDADKSITGAQHYKIRYRVWNAFLYEADGVKFYWNLKPSNWRATFNSIVFSVHLPTSIAADTSDVFVYSGLSATTDLSRNFDVTIANGVVEGKSQPGFESEEGQSVTILINLPPNAIAEIKPLWPFWTDYGWVFVLLALLGGFYMTWKSYGKDDEVISSTSYFPPKGMDPAMAGFLMNDADDTSDLISLIPYWGSKGILRIEEIPKKGWFSSSDTKLVALKALPDEASSYERTIFSGLFGSSISPDDTEVLISSLKDKFYTKMSSARSVLKKQAQPYYEGGSKRVRNITYGSIILVTIVLVPVLLFVWGFIATFALVILNVLLLIMNRFMVKKNPKGNAAFSELKGFKQFIKVAEINKLKMLIIEDPSYFETTMGYALAFGLFDKWANKFDALNIPPPSWYSSAAHTNFTMSSFTNSFANTMSTATSTMVSSPSSSGSSGGGSSGGGFGGGGGGSW
ncbi:putative membrane protein DUF2207 [Gelidibacter algens]|uniref:Putative membrane protein DUF2207 n=1 Tax=Gelidibacter algens TaxID=49280 RepID=A0A1A7R5V6_9FLAO|nr:DUF2207 domain-containing protein [Gelidibacter algens]OBX26132.1 hypothetical protein A9996_06280 [Gelidibacter algens]RAJ24507.1 putative membrane protein DUF2207 [Gelidibacter algens]